MATNKEAWSANNYKTVNLFNATVKYPNLAGAKRTYNEEGKRNFNVELDPATAQEYMDMGLNVREKEDRNGDIHYMMKINVNFDFDNRRPEIYLVSGNNKTLVEPEDLHTVDDAYLDGSVVCTDISFRTSRAKSRTDNWGLSAYLKKMYVNIEEDELDAKYGNIDNEISGNLDEEDPFDL